LIRKIEHSISAQKKPIIIAGRKHVLSNEVQAFSKKKGIVCISLHPNNTPLESSVQSNDEKNKSLTHENKEENLLFETLDSVSDFWSEYAIIAKFVSDTGNSKPGTMRSFTLSNDHLFSALKRKIKDYTFDENTIFLWGGFPTFVYISEYHKLEN